jgi:hypothetical protein
VNFYVKLPQREGYEYSDVTFTISSAEGETVVPYSPDMETNSKGYFKFPYYVRSIQMADTITATLHYTVNGEERTLEKTYSVKQYFETFDEYQDQFSEKQQNMTKAVADYGHYVQAFLDSTRDWNVPEDYAEMDKYYMDYTEADIAEAQAGLAEYAIVREVSADITKITFTTVLDSDTAIRVFFTPVKNYAGSIEFKLDGNVIEAAQQSDGRYMVEIGNIPANELSTTHEIYVTTDNGVAHVSVSALSYAKAMMDAYAGNTLAINAAVAIYRYAKFADEME